MAPGPSRAGSAAYRLLLRLLPADVRRDFGDDMAQMFRDRRREAGRRPVRLLSVWLTAIGDVVATAAAARRGRRRDVSASRGSALTLVTGLRQGFRLVGRYRSSSLTAIATLALGIGANTAIFSLVDGVILHTLPYRDPARLMEVFEKRPKEGNMTGVVSPADFLDWRARSQSWSALAAYQETEVALTGAGDPVELEAADVSSGFFDVLGVEPVLGRTFRPGDERPGDDKVALLTHGCWERRFGADPTIVGRTIDLDGAPWTVIGVLPADYHFIESSQEVWLPLPLVTPGSAPPRASHFLSVYGRLKPGVTVAQARDDMDRLGRELEQEHPNENTGHSPNVIPMDEALTQSVRTSLIVLLTAVGFVLLIACVNVASLLLARGSTRTREMAVRASLGATRGRLLIQGLGESLALASLGGVAGVAVASITLHALPSVLPDQIALVDVAGITLNTRLLVFALGLTVATGLVFGFLPAWHGSRPDLNSTLKIGGRSAAGVSTLARRTLVIGEVTLATATLFGAGLALRSFGAILSQPLGFESTGRLAATVVLPVRRYASADLQRTFIAGLHDRLAAIPGVTAAGATTILPLTGSDSRRGVTIEGRAPIAGEPPVRMHLRSVTTEYLQAMGVPILRGREFGAADDERGQRVGIVNQTAAKRFWPGVDPVGRRFQFAPTEPWWTVVGVAGDVKEWGLNRDVNPLVYLPFAQRPAAAMTFVLAGPGDPRALTGPVRATVRQADPDLPVTDVATLDRVVDDSVRGQRAQATLMAAFGAVALALSAIGIFGVLAHLVSARTYEIGMRMTLGARPATIFRRLVAETVTETGIGLAIGLAAGVALMRVERTVLFNVAPWDAVTLASVAGILLAAAVGAVVIPGRRAMRIDPVRALRAD